MIEIIKDGSLERLVIAVIVFGGMVGLLFKDGVIDERMFDVAFVIVGFYFGSTVANFRFQNGHSTKVPS
jgi:hypothetical protein